MDYTLHTLGFSPWGTCAGSGYGNLRFIPVPFSRAPGISCVPHRDTILRFSEVLIVTILPSHALINTADKPWQPTPKRQKQDFRRRILRLYRNINLFPFPHTLQLGAQLGPIYPWLICIAKEPLPFR